MTNTISTTYAKLLLVGKTKKRGRKLGEFLDKILKKREKKGLL